MPLGNVIVVGLQPSTPKKEANEDRLCGGVLVWDFLGRRGRQAVFCSVSVLVVKPGECPSRTLPSGSYAVVSVYASLCSLCIRTAEPLVGVGVYVPPCRFPRVYRCHFDTAATETERNLDVVGADRC